MSPEPRTRTGDVDAEPVAPAPVQAASASAEASAGARVETFRRDIAAMRVRDVGASKERALLALGAVGLVVGIVLAGAGYLKSNGTTDPLSQRDALAIGIFGLTLAVGGATMFLRYSLGRLLRFWLARLTFEQGAQTDRIVEAIGDDR